MELIRRCWAEIDLDQMEKNYHALRSKIDPETRMMGVVKADAYGHGAVQSATLLAELGINWFGVSNLSEAIQLRQGGITQPILVLGYTSPECADLLAQEKITQTVYSREYLQALARAAELAGVSVEVHVKIDTGMGRIGFDPDSEEDFSTLCGLKDKKNLKMTGIFTHFAVADENGDGLEYTQEQFKKFRKLCERLENAGVEVGLRHCCNSAGILRCPEMQMDMVRAGISLYGLLPSNDCQGDIDTYPVMAWRSVVSMVKEIAPGQTVSYGRTYMAHRPMRVATVAVGYADGYSRSHSNRGYVLIHGKKAPILGRVCMDQCIVDVTDIPDVMMGDQVTLAGCDDAECISFDHLAELSGTINYELICLVGKRVDRIFLRNGCRIAAEGLI